MVVVRVDSDDIVILSEVPQSNYEPSKIYNFPLGQTLRVDLDDGKIDRLKPYEKPKLGLFGSILKKKDPNSITELEKIYINGQIVEDYPAVYITLHKSLPELKQSIRKITDEDIMEEYTEARLKNNRVTKIDDNMIGGSNCVYQNGGINIIKYLKIEKQLKDLKKLFNSINKNKKVNNDLITLDEETIKYFKNKINNIKNKNQIGGSDIIKLFKKIIKDTQKISNKTMKKINKNIKKSLVYFKGGKYLKAQKMIKESCIYCKNGKKILKGGKYEISKDVKDIVDTGKKMKLNEKFEIEKKKIDKEIEKIEKEIEKIEKFKKEMIALPKNELKKLVKKNEKIEDLLNRMTKRQDMKIKDKKNEIKSLIKKIDNKKKEIFNILK